MSRLGMCTVLLGAGDSSSLSPQAATLYCTLATRTGEAGRGTRQALSNQALYTVRIEWWFRLKYPLEYLAEYGCFTNLGVLIFIVRY